MDGFAQKLPHFSEGRAFTRSDHAVSPLATARDGFAGKTHSYHRVAAAIEASRVNETMRRLHFSTPEKPGPGDGMGAMLTRGVSMESPGVTLSAGYPRPA